MQHFYTVKLQLILQLDIGVT